MKSLLLLGLIACAPVPPSAPSGESISYVDGAPQPEDLAVLPGTTLAIVSAMKGDNGSGRLLVLDTVRATLAPLVPATAGGGPAPAVFAPHGIGVRPLGSGAFEVLVVDHGGGEAIDRFRVHVVDGKVTVDGFDAVPMPAGTSGNGVVPTADGFLVTSMFDPRESTFVARSERREPTGSVWRWSSAGWETLGPPLSAANGIALSGDGRTAFVSEWAARRFWRIPLAGGEARSVDVDFMPDNVRWRSDGRLLVAGQVASPAALMGCFDKKPCPLGFAVVSIDPGSLAVESILRSETANAQGFGGVTVALQTDRSLWLGSFRGTRIGRLAVQ